MKEETYWDGRPAKCRRVQIIVGAVPAKTWWCWGLTGTVRRAVEVDLGTHRFYIDDQTDDEMSGWRKVTEGLGGWNWGHRSLPVECVVESWTEVVNWMRETLGREPTTEELVEKSREYEMTPEELQTQKESWARATVSTGDPRFD